MCTCAHPKPNNEVDPITGLVKLCALVVVAHQGYQALNRSASTASSMTVVNGAPTDDLGRMIQLMGMLRG